MKYFKGNRKNKFKIVFILLISLIVIIVYQAYINSQPNEFVRTKNYIEFTGSYGTKIYYSEIQNIQQINKPPKIESRINGFFLGNIKKGKFKIESGEIVHLLIDESYRPILKVTLKNQKKLFFNSKKENSAKEYEKLQNIFAYQKKPLFK